MIDRVAHARLRGEMNHMCKPVPLEQREQRFTIGEIDLLEFEPVVVLQDGEPRVLQGRIVVGVQIVEADDGAPLLQQPLGDMKADEARRARDQHRILRHYVLSPTKSLQSRMTLLAKCHPVRGSLLGT